MPGADILSIGLSGTMAADRALATTSHNIANANTDGYSRQRVELESRNPQYSGIGSIGTGVEVDNIRRMYDNFIIGEVNRTSSVYYGLESGFQFTSQVDDMLADPQAGLSPTLQSFFDAINGMANDPSSRSARQVVIGEANSLAERFKYMSGRLDILRKGVNDALRTNITEVNDLARSIADINAKILLAKEVSPKPANDLIDQRDRMILKLSEKINVTSVEQDDGTYNVFIGNGQTLVLGTRSSKLGVAESQFDATQLEVSYFNGSGQAEITQFLKGGAIGGLLEFRSYILDPAQNELGRIALGIAKSFNGLHRLGMDLNNNLGQDFFTPIDTSSPQVLPSRENSGNARLKMQITAIDNLTTSDYRLEFIQGKFRLVRLQDDKLVSEFTSLPADFPGEGFNIINPTNEPIIEGDTFILRPTRAASNRFSVKIENLDEIAAAAPVRVDRSINNLGDGEAEVTSIRDTTTPAFMPALGTLSPEITIRFIDPTHIELLDDKGNVIPVQQLKDLNPAIPSIQYDDNGQPRTTPSIPALQAVNLDPAAPSAVVMETAIEYDPEKGLQLFPTPAGYEPGYAVLVRGEQQEGDVFTIKYNSDSTGDNRNALALAELQTRPVLVNGTADYGEVYAQLVSKVGSKTHELAINQQAQKLLLDQAIDRREAVSGVNLDEEAANIVRFQNYYQANAQVVNTANRMFDTLISMFRR